MVPFAAPAKIGKNKLIGGIFSGQFECQEFPGVAFGAAGDGFRATGT